MYEYALVNEKRVFQNRELSTDQTGLFSLNVFKIP